MKYRLFTLLALSGVLFSSCVKENFPAEGGSILAVMENDDTRTSVTDEGVFTWSEGDKVWLHTTSEGVVGTLSSGAGTASANFSYGSYFGAMTGKSVYPYNEGHSISGDVLSVVMPASYDLGSALTNTNAAMYGLLSDGRLRFNHMAGVMRFKFNNVPAGVNKFTITLDKKISGTFTADLTEAFPVIESEETSVASEKTITLNFNALTETSDIALYVPLPLGTYNSLDLALYSGAKSVWTYSKSVTNTIARKSLKLMPAVTLGGTIGGDIEGGESEEELKAISYVPASEDGKATVMFVNKEDSYVEMDFEVSPKSMAAKIAENWEEVLSLESVSDLPIVSCEADAETGTISIKATCSSLSDDFFAGAQGVSARLNVSTGLNDVSSESIHLVANRYARTTEYFMKATFESIEEGQEVYLYFERVIGGTSNPIVCIDYGDGEFGIEQFHKYEHPGDYNVIFYFDKPVAEICDFAFMGVPSLKCITIPNTVETIGYLAFYGGSLYNYNKLLENVTFENESRLKTIEAGAFACNPALKQLSLPSTVENIEEKVFAFCPSLESVRSHGVYFNYGADFGSYLVKDQSNNVSQVVLIPSNSGCEDIELGGLSFVLIPGAVTANNTLRRVRFYHGLLEIGEYNFIDCENLENVDMSETQKIGTNVFINCSSLKEVSMPVVSEISTYSICDNTSLELIDFGSPDLKTLEQVGNNNPKLREIHIPSGVTTITNSFNGASSIESVYVSSTVPPTLMNSFDSMALPLIYVPADYEYDYKVALDWSSYADSIVGYDFENGMVVE